MEQDQITSNTSLTFKCEYDWQTIGFSKAKTKEMKVALGTFNETGENWIDILQVNENKSSIEPMQQIKSEFPVTKLMFGKDFPGVR